MQRKWACLSARHLCRNCRSKELKMKNMRKAMRRDRLGNVPVSLKKEDSLSSFLNLFAEIKPCRVLQRDSAGAINPHLLVQVPQQA